MSTRVAGLFLTASLLAVGGCSSDDHPGTTASRSTTSTTTTAGAAHDRAIFHGTATVNGAPFDARWVGAVVLRDGLVTPCQYSLPPVTDGKYSVTVYADTESAGCGAPGTQVALWTFAGGHILYSSDTVAWPGNGRSATFAPRYSTASPAGRVPVTAQFSGSVFRRNRSQLPPGTTIEAYVGTTRCGVASVRTSPGFTGYSLDVVGPDSIAGCTRSAPLTFRIDGKPAAKTTAVNTPPGQRAALDLALP